MGCSCRSRARRSSSWSAAGSATGGLAGAAVEGFRTTGRFRLFAGTCGAAWLAPKAEPDNAATNRKAGARNLSGATASLRTRKESPPVSGCGFIFASKLTPYNRRGIRITPESLWISLAKDFDHPVIKVIHWMAQNRLEAPVIFFVSLFNIISQTETNVSMLPSQTDLVGPEHLNILHRNFGDAIGSPV